MKEEKYYQVISDLSAVPLRDHMMHGFEERQDFFNSVRQLRDRWQDRVGECVDRRNGFVLLRFHDTPGGMPDEAWLPDYLVLPVSKPSYLQKKEPTQQELLEAEIDEAFGF